MHTKTRRYLIYMFLLMCLVLLSIPAAAQDSGYSPVTHIDLGVTSLTLDPGESYEFQITYEPADPAIRTLTWSRMKVWSGSTR